MTELAGARTDTAVGAPRPSLSAMAAGVVGGCALGVVARAWMRLIAPDPEFTWTGTIFIVAAFTFFGLAQSVVAVTRKRLSRRWKVTIVRTFGAMAMLPLFVAAGAVMLPTVAGCGLAVARTGWPTITRSACLVVAAGPVLFVGRDLVDSFGWSLHTLAGFVVMLAIYAVIIWATRFTFTAQPDGWRLTRRARVVVPLVIAVLVLILFVAGGGFQ